MNISRFNINVDFIAYDNITANNLKSYFKHPHQTQAGIFMLCSKGTMKITINHRDYRIITNDLLTLPPETFIQLATASEDLLLHIVVFSQRLIQNATMGKAIIDKFQIIGKHYILPLPKVTFPLYLETFTLLAHLHRKVNHLLSPNILELLLNLTLQGISELCPEQTKLKETPGSRHFQQYRLFIRLVHAFYYQQHRVAFYAKEMNMKPSALCRLIKKESGHTAMEIINKTLIMDARTQLHTCNIPVKDIAFSLGFNNAAFFNKFFKKHVGTTPQTFRNAKKEFVHR